MHLDSAVACKAEITLLKKNRHKFLDFQVSDKSCGHTENYKKNRNPSQRSLNMDFQIKCLSLSTSNIQSMEEIWYTK